MKPKTCPGVPAGPPPLMSDYVDLNDDEGVNDGERKRKIRFDESADDKDEEGPSVDPVQRKLLAMSGGQDVDAYMKEMEEVHRQTQAEKEREMQNRLSRIEQNQPQPPGVGEGPPAGPPKPPGPPQGAPSGMMPPTTRPPMMYRPSLPFRPGVAPPGVRLPPGPPPGRPVMPQGVRMPPGPPPGVPPPRMGMARGPHRPPGPGHQGAGGVLSAGPQLIQKDQGKKNIGSTVITAKPQMRNLASDVTRFVPTNVKVKRDADSRPIGPGKDMMKRRQANASGNLNIASFRIFNANGGYFCLLLDPMKDIFVKHQPQGSTGQSKDDAYAQFMREMDEMMK